MHIIWEHSCSKWLTACFSSGNWFLKAHLSLCHMALRSQSHRQLSEVRGIVWNLLLCILCTAFYLSYMPSWHARGQLYRLLPFKQLDNLPHFTHILYTTCAVVLTYWTVPVVTALWKFGGFHRFYITLKNIKFYVIKLFQSNLHH